MVKLGGASVCSQDKGKEGALAFLPSFVHLLIHSINTARGWLGGPGCLHSIISGGRAMLVGSHEASVCGRERPSDFPTAQ